MQYGYFDDQAKEYVITRPDTPQSWSNYLGSTTYGAIITNNAGGYGFYKSGAQGRFLRLRFNSVPMDQPGRYFYLRDKENGDYWSASWQPVGKPLHEYQSTCRHGTAYTTITSSYAGISTEAGIPDFRGPGGIWEDPKLLNQLSVTGFRTNTEGFYKESVRLFSNMAGAKPTLAHQLLVRLEKLGKLNAVSTQNIDGLHRVAGSTNVYELHGTYRTGHCIECRREYEMMNFYSIGIFPVA